MVTYSLKCGAVPTFDKVNWIKIFTLKEIVSLSNLSYEMALLHFKGQFQEIYFEELERRATFKYSF